MALFGKKKSKADSKEAAEKKDKPAFKENVDEFGNEKKKTEEIKKSKNEIGRVTKDIILEPWITEKSHVHMALNKYIFRVNPAYGKKDLKIAIETMYKVGVNNVNVINIPSKKRVYGRFVGKKSGYKKAVVTLREGDKIELFKGV